ncbi:MAG: hypothetical protein K1X94_18950 [Sandaracinaceae bacterium]|nr:hypothetical protein [Sandaracinaceae bacterium]
MTSRPKSFAFSMQGDLGIVVHTHRDPSPEEWSGLVEALGRIDLDSFRTLSVTEGGAPNSAQREQVNRLLGGRQRPAAVLTNHLSVRGVVTALGWFNPLIRAFPTDGLPEALDYLGVDRARLPVIEAEIRRLRAQL